MWGAQLPQQLYATVGSDNTTGGQLATAHLLAQGARRVLFIGDPGLPEVGQRMRGWQQAHQQAGLVADDRLVRPVPFVPTRCGWNWSGWWPTACPSTPCLPPATCWP